MKSITSRQNPLVKAVHVLAASAQERRREGKTLLDGVHLVQAALEHGIALESVWVSEHGQHHPEIATLLDRLPGTLACICVPDTVFAHISPTDTPAGILAVMRLPSVSVQPPVTGSCVVLDGVQDAGNLGTILRTAAAAGVQDILLTQGCAQAWSPRVLRAAMGAHFRLRIREKADVPGLLNGYTGTILSTGVKDAQSLYATDLRGPVAWLFGSEGAGVSEEIAVLAQHWVMIPMAGGTESLNVAAAAAICLFEQRRQGQPDL